MVNRIYGGVIAPQEPVRSGQQTRQGGDFHAALQQELQRSEQTREVAFSKHAISRAEQRGIEITPNLIDQLKGSMIRAQAKGATNILAMDAEKAFIINVPNAKVITAITQEEMKGILQTFSLEQYAGTIAKWYDGYRFGLTEIYNPWSVLNCIDSYLQNDMVACEPYWSNTSSNRIVKRLIEESNERTKSMVEELINGTPIHTQIFEDVTYGTIDVNQDYIWSFLLFTGYLKIISCETIGDETYYDMVIPNVEIKSIYKNTIRSWFIDHINRDSRTDILESVIHADAEKLEDLLCTWLTNTISCFDEQENYYHGFVTGLVSGFNGYMVVSNRESGNGRFDLVVKQRSRWHHAAILEFKVVEKYNQMTKACEDALRQIEEKDYEASLRDEQYENIAKLGICFCQKRCRVKSGGVDHFEY